MPSRVVLQIRDVPFGRRAVAVSGFYLDRVNAGEIIPVIVVAVSPQRVETARARRIQLASTPSSAAAAVAMSEYATSRRSMRHAI